MIRKQSGKTPNLGSLLSSLISDFLLLHLLSHIPSHFLIFYRSRRNPKISLLYKLQIPAAKMVSFGICLLTVALCLSSGFHQGYIASVLTQPYIAIQHYINSSWIERTGEPIEKNALVGLVLPESKISRLSKEINHFLSIS